MSKFVLIDHSLRNLGGHYYTYACCVLSAAERAGFQPVLATHCKFRDMEALPQTWTAHAVYLRKSYSGRSSQVPAMRTPSMFSMPAWLHRLRIALQRRLDLRIARGFARDCAKLFQRVALNPGDHVFVATATELDLLGLALYLRSRGVRGQVTWHLQFHLSLFDGRYPDYAAQLRARDGLRATFREALALVKQHDVRLYCTTEQLTEQYNLLDTADFATLTYPVHDLFRMTSRTALTADPIRIACLGHNRKEKGYRQLPLIVRSIWDEYLRSGRVQLILQTARSELRRALRHTVTQLGVVPGAQPIGYAPFPVALERYAQLVHESGIGLLLYDGAQYYARCSGVLIEMLAAGVPVIVPAGGWLAEQIDEENQCYLERALMTMDPGRILGRIEPQWSEHADGLRSMGSRRPQWLTLPVREAAEGQVLVGSDCTSLMICFVLRTPTMRGVYVRVSISEVDARGTTLAVHETILARREEGRALHVSFSLNENVSRVLVKVSNAWHDSELMIRDFECVLLSGERFPCASVGLTAASVEQSGELLLEILRYYDHYRERAARFSAQCIRLHDPGKIIDRLTGRPAEERPLPARRAQPEMPGSILRKLHGPVASSQE